MQVIYQVKLIGFNEVGRLFLNQEDAESHKSYLNGLHQAKAGISPYGVFRLYVHTEAVSKVVP